MTTACAAIPSYSSTEESTNFGKLCRLLLDIGTDVLREKFDNLIQAGHLCEFLASHKSKLKKKLSGYQTKKLYPENGSPSSATFDISLLYLLLREGCDIEPPVNGWGKLPDPSDLNDSANIERLRQARNDLYGHAQRATIKKEAYLAAWQELSGALISLGGEKYRSAIDSLYGTSLDMVGFKERKDRVIEWTLLEHRLESMLVYHILNRVYIALGR